MRALDAASCDSKATISPRAETATSSSRRSRLTESNVLNDSSRPREWARKPTIDGEPGEDEEEQDWCGQREQLASDLVVAVGERLDDLVRAQIDEYGGDVAVPSAKTIRSMRPARFSAAFAFRCLSEARMTSLLASACLDLVACADLSGADSVEMERASRGTRGAGRPRGGERAPPALRS